MWIKHSPVGGFEENIAYIFVENEITATYQGESITYDVANMPVDEEGVMVVERINGIRPILNVYNKEGEYWVEIRNHIGSDATEEEKFPDWFEV